MLINIMQSIGAFMKLRPSFILKVFIIFTFSFIILLPIIQAENVEYKGINKCGGRQLEVRFLYDSSNSVITEFEATHSCIPELNDGKGNITDKLKGTIEVKDNKFMIDSFIIGYISSDGTASGKFLGDIHYIQAECADKKSYKNCSEWTAKVNK